MFKFLKKVWRDRRGNALVIVGAALPLLVGAAGLATDSIQWVLWKRELQRGADSAAFAGVYAKAQSADASTAVTADLSNNNKTGITLLTGYPQIAYPTSGSWTNAVQVTLAIRKTLGFSSLFMSTAPTITATGTAAMVDDGDYCLVALKKSGGAAITIGGSASANLGCGAISNANVNPSVSTNGGSYNLTAPVVAGVGTLPATITGVTTLAPHHMALPDPFDGKYSTDIPAGMSCNNFNTHKTNLGTGNAPNFHLSPGCYTGFNPNGSNTYTLDPGVYYLNNTDFQLNGNDTLIGNDVTIILTGTTPGSLVTNGNSTVQLSAPTATNCGTYGGVNTCNYKNMLFIQASNATADNNNNINGSATSNWDGAFYFPKGQISFTGTSSSTTKCAMVVGYTVVFSGNTGLQNTTTGCTANETVKGKTIRLVA